MLRGDIPRIYFSPDTVFVQCRSPNASKIWNFIQANATYSHSLNRRWDLDLSAFSVAQRNTVSPSHTAGSSSICSSLINLDITELEVPSLALDSFDRRSLLLHLPHIRRILLLILRLRSRIRKRSALFWTNTSDLLLSSQDKLRMWDAGVGREKIVIEDLSGVFAVELARLGGWPEDLLGCGLMHWKVVDGFEFRALLMLWDDAGDGAGVWLCKTLALLIVR